MRYFPLRSDRFEHQFGIRALAADESIVEVTDRYAAEIELKTNLLAEDPNNYVASLPGSEEEQQEAAELLADSVRRVGMDPSLGRDGSTSLLGVAGAIQEDVVVMRGDAEAGFPVIAGVVCFPSGWTIAAKLGKSVLQVHRPVPEYAEVMSRSTDKLLAQLKPARPVWRMNWGVRRSGRLDQSPKHLLDDNGEITDAGSQCFFRVERQTLSRLPKTEAILFTIHTHQCQLSGLEPWQKENLLGFLRTCPAETLDYKGINGIFEQVCRYLELQSSDAD